MPFWERGEVIFILPTPMLFPRMDSEQVNLLLSFMEGLIQVSLLIDTGIFSAYTFSQFYPSYTNSKSKMISRRQGGGDETYCTYVEEADDAANKDSALI